MTLRRKIFVVFSGVGLVLAGLWFVLLGGGPEPLEVVASEPQDAIVSVERPVDLLLGVRDFLAAAKFEAANQFKDLPPAWLLKLGGANATAAFGIRFDSQDVNHPLFLAALKGGRVSHLAALPFVGDKPLEMDDTRLYRMGSLFVLQGGRSRPVSTGGSAEFLPEGQIRAFVRVRRISEVTGTAGDLEQLDRLRLPWPLETLSLSADFRSGELLLEAKGAYSPSLAGPRVSRIQAEPALPPLAASYAAEDKTVLAVSWFAPDGLDVRTALTDLTPPDPVYAARYQAALSRFTGQGLRGVCGRRAALLIAGQDNRIKPGYPGIGFVQELRPGHGLRNALRDFLASVTVGIVREGEPHPAAFPYFEERPAGGGLPWRLVFYSEMLRPSEGYQPLVSVGDTALVYASSEEMLQTMVSAEGFEDETECHASVIYINQGPEVFDQLEVFYKYVLQEELASRSTGKMLEDSTDYYELFRRIRRSLTLIKQARLRLTYEKPGLIAVTTRIAPEEGGR